MKKAITVKQKSVGRPPTGQTPMMGFRASAELRRAIEVWAQSQPSPPKLSVAVRRLVELGLTVKPTKARGSSKSAARAAELAAKVIDERIAADAPEDERTTRKQRLLKGPAAFRDIRKDRAK